MGQKKGRDQGGELVYMAPSRQCYTVGSIAALTSWKGVPCCDFLNIGRAIGIKYVQWETNKGLVCAKGLGLTPKSTLFTEQSGYVYYHLKTINPRIHKARPSTKSMAGSVFCKSTAKLNPMTKGFPCSSWRTDTDFPCTRAVRKLEKSELAI